MKRFSKKWWFHSEKCTGMDICGEYASMTIPPIVVLICAVLSVLDVAALIIIELSK